MTDLRSEAEAMVADLRIDKESEVVQGVADIITKLLSAWGEAVASGSLAAGAMIEQTRIIDNLRAEIAKVTAERDEAVSDAREIAETNLHAQAYINGQKFACEALRAQLAAATEERDKAKHELASDEHFKRAAELATELLAAREALAKAVEDEREAAALKAMEWARVTPFPKRHALVHLTDEDFNCLAAETEAEDRSARAIAAAIRARKEPTP